jgi:hypothetical protein
MAATLNDRAAAATVLNNAYRMVSSKRLRPVIVPGNDLQRAGMI